MFLIVNFSYNFSYIYASCLSTENSLQQNKVLLFVNPNGAGGHNVPALFSEGYFSMKKGFWRSKNFLPPDPFSWRNSLLKKVRAGGHIVPSPPHTHHCLTVFMYSFCESESQRENLAMNIDKVAEYHVFMMGGKD